MSVMAHIHHLAETIGARGSTTAKEAEAAQYARQVFQEAGLAPTTEPFTSARSSYYPYALFYALVLASIILFWVGGRLGSILGLVLTAPALISVLLEAAFRPNLLRMVLPKGQSQNVWVKVAPRDEPKELVVLLGHLDTHRTPLLFSSDNWVKVLGYLTPIALIATGLAIILFIIGLGSSGMVWRYLSLLPALVVLASLLLMLQADFTDYAPGANDNATGAAVVMSTAQKLSQHPLAHTTVWAVCTGCEEVGCYGAEAFAKAHQAELTHPAWLSIDTVGGVGAGVAYLTSERFLLTTHSDPDLIRLAGQIAADRSELDAYPHQFKSTYTEGAIGGKYKFRVFSLVGFRRDGILPHWHRPTDVIENLEPAVIDRAETFVWEFLQRLDQRAGRD